MHWWEETERRALATRGQAALALTFWQRLREAGCPADLALLPAQGLAGLYSSGIDLVHWVDGLLTADAQSLESHLLALRAWVREAAFRIRESHRPFLLLLDGLRVDPEEFPQEPEEDLPAGVLPPEAAPKWEGRYEQRHLLYERLDIRLEALGMAGPVRRPFAHSLATVYEEFMVLLRRLQPLTGPHGRLRLREAVALISDVTATFHLDLGPRHLESLRAEPGRPAIPGLGTWLDLALASLTPGGLPPEWLAEGTGAG